jgi:hypothetical protein
MLLSDNKLVREATDGPLLLIFEKPAEALPSLRRRTGCYYYLDVEQRREEELRPEHFVVAEHPDAVRLAVAQPLVHVPVAPGLDDAHAAVVALDVRAPRRLALALGAADAAGDGEVGVEPGEHGVLEYLGGDRAGRLPGRVVVDAAQVVQLEGQIGVRQLVVHLAGHRAWHHRGEAVAVHRSRGRRLFLLEHHFVERRLVPSRSGCWKLELRAAESARLAPAMDGEGGGAQAQRTRA